MNFANKSEQRNPRVLWANMFCLLDTSSGASISVKQILHELKASGFGISIVGATCFDAEKGMLRLKPHWEALQNNPDGVVKIEYEGMEHCLAITKDYRRSEITADEINNWFSIYVTYLELFKPDVVFFYGGHPIDHLIPDEARARGIPSVAYLVNGNFSGARWCRDVDLILTDTFATAKLYAENEGYPVTPIGKFINPARVVVENNTRERILFINPSPQKGVGIVVQLAMLLEKKRPDIFIEVVESRGDWHDAVQAVTLASGCERESLSNVIVTPNTDDMRQVYSRARILLAPSLWWESGARVLAEAMLNGIPSIVTDYGGSPEMIGNAGFKLKLPDACYAKTYDQLPNLALLEPLIEKIEQLFDDENYYQEYVRRAYAVGEQQHNIAVSTRRLIEALTPLLKRRAGDFDHQHNISKFHKFGLKSSIDHTAQAERVEQNKLTHALAPKQRGLFIDCGGYDGCSAVKFMLQNPQFDSITLEPNPALWPHYADVPTTLIKKAAYTHDGTMIFTIDETDADGSSLVESKKIDWHGKVTNEECPKIEVGCVDIAELIRKAATQYQKIVLKLDIEGAEYDVLEKLLQEDLVKHLTIIYAEFHWHKCGFPESRHNELVSALQQQTQVAEWDALDFAIYRGTDERKQQRAATVRAKLGDLTRYQNLSLLPKE